MDPKRLLIFRTVARAGSIRAAARELRWTQRAVSQHLRALERAAGCALLLRGAGGVELTEPGRVLLARADAVAVQLHMAEEELAELTALRRGRVRLAAYPSAAATLVPRAVARLRARHPDIDVELTEAEPPEALDLLSAGDTDLALVFSYDGSEPAAALSWRPLGDEPVALVLAADHPAAERRRLSLTDLAGEPWIVGCERCRPTPWRCVPRRASPPRSGTSAMTTWSSRTSWRSGWASHCSRGRRWTPIVTPTCACGSTRRSAPGPSGSSTARAPTWSRPPPRWCASWGVCRIGRNVFVEWVQAPPPTTRNEDLRCAPCTSPSSSPWTASWRRPAVRRDTGTPAGASTSRTTRRGSSTRPRRPSAPRPCCWGGTPTKASPRPGPRGTATSPTSSTPWRRSSCRRR